MSSISVIIITILICFLWSGIWALVFNCFEKEWMYVAGCGPFLWLCLGISAIVSKAQKTYYHYYYKAVVTNESGDKFWCNSKDMNAICKQYDMKPAVEFVKETNYKPYKPQVYNFKKNPRYVYRDVACKFPEVSRIKNKNTF